MSQIASFYTLPIARFDDLVAAATPRLVTVETRRFLFKRTVEQVVDEFWEFVRDVARESEKCPYPGSVFLDLDLILQSHDLALFDLGERGLTDRLSRARDAPPEPAKRHAWPESAPSSQIPVFDHATASAALARLEACELTRDEVRDYVRDEYPAEDRKAATATILGAFDLAKRWLASVKSDEVGFLNVG